MVWAANPTKNTGDTITAAEANNINAGVTQGTAAGPWNQLHQTTININGVVNCTCDWAWYTNASFVCELRFKFTVPSGNFPAVNFLTVPFPGTIPVPQTSPLVTTGRHGIAQMNYVSAPVRLDPGGTFYVFSNSYGSAPYVEGSMSYQIAVP